MLRSNQFNLRTQRRTPADCERLMNDVDGFTPLYATLEDRFGDHGLISIVVMEWRAADVFLSDWLMSCRVLSRGVEQFLMNRVVALAAERRRHRVSAEYIPTAKNGMVRDFYMQFGFKLEGPNQWTLDVESYVPLRTYIGEMALWK